MHLPTLATMNTAEKSQGQQLGLSCTVICVSSAAYLIKHCMEMGSNSGHWHDLVT